MTKAETPLPLYLVFLLLTGASACTTLKVLDYEGWDRDEWQHPQRVVESLDIREGSQIADIGSGSGYFTFRLAKPVGPEGTIFAVDLDAGLNDYVRQEARARGHGNVQVITAKPEDPLLPEAGVDLIFSCNTYHHIQNRAQYFAGARRYLRPGGSVAIVGLRQFELDSTSTGTLGRKGSDSARDDGGRLPPETEVRLPTEAAFPDLRNF